MKKITLPSEARFALAFANADWSTPWLEKFQEWRANGAALPLDVIASHQDNLRTQLTALAKGRLSLAPMRVRVVAGSVGGDIELSALPPDEDLESALVVGLMQLKARRPYRVAQCVSCQDFFWAKGNGRVCGVRDCSDSAHKRQQARERMTRFRAAARAAREGRAKKARARLRDLPGLITRAYRAGEITIAEKLRKESETLSESLRRARSAKKLATRGARAVRVVVGRPGSPVPWSDPFKE